MHTCITKKVYAQFASDGLDVTDLAGDDELTSDDDGSPPITPRLQQSTHTPVTTASTSSATAANSSSITTPSPSTVSAPLQRNRSLSTIASLPPVIWKHHWVPQSGRYEGLFSLETFAQGVYDAATSGVHYEELEVRGVDVTGMAATFKKMVREAIQRRDFTDILSPEREFYV